MRESEEREIEIERKTDTDTTTTIATATATHSLAVSRRRLNFYGVATISTLLKIIGLFCRISSVL